MSLPSLMPGPVMAADPLPPSFIPYYWSAETAFAYGKRSIRNIASASEPTPNLLPDPFVMADEDGGTTPTRSPFNAGVTDPLGGNAALVAGFTAQLQPLTHYNRANNPGLPLDSYTARVKIRKADTSTGAIGIGSAGGNAGQFTSVSISDDWQTLQHTNTGYSAAGAFELGIRTNSGVTTVNAALFNRQLYDSVSVIASDAAEWAAAQGSHAKPPVAYANSVPVNAGGEIDPTLDANFKNLVASFQNLDCPGFTLGGVMDVTQNTPGATYGNLACVALHQTGQSNTTGQVGFYKDTYRYYANPGLSTLASRCTAHFLNNGPATVMVTYENGAGQHYVQGVPILQDYAPAYTPFKLHRLNFFGNNNTRPLTQSGNGYRDKAGDILFAPARLTTAQAREADAYIRARRATKGRPRLSRKIAVIGCGDSRTAFTPSPFWALSADPSLRPGFWCYLEAWGGTFYATSGNGYADPARRDFRNLQTAAALAAGFDEVWLQWFYATNDANGAGRVMNTLAIWPSGRDTINGMIMADKAACDDGSGRLKTVIVTVPNIASFTPERQAVIDAFNADAVANYASYGFDAVIDHGGSAPAGFASWLACSADAIANNGNAHLLNDGIHYSVPGGQSAAAKDFGPFYAARLAALS